MTEVFITDITDGIRKLENVFRHPEIPVKLSNTIDVEMNTLGRRKVNKIYKRLELLNIKVVGLMGENGRGRQDFQKNKYARIHTKIEHTSTLVTK